LRSTSGLFIKGLLPSLKSNRQLSSACEGRHVASASPG
jgi:hypothetical protein